jgi:hypothetical protein
MSALLLPVAFLAILGLYSFVEDVIWALRPMARPMTKRELKKAYAMKGVRKPH